jgi:hypothetical protein
MFPSLEPAEIDRLRRFGERREREGEREEPNYGPYEVLASGSLTAFGKSGFR